MVQHKLPLLAFANCSYLFVKCLMFCNIVEMNTLGDRLKGKNVFQLHAEKTTLSLIV